MNQMTNTSETFFCYTQIPADGWQPGGALQLLRADRARTLTHRGDDVADRR